MSDRMSIEDLRRLALEKGYTLEEDDGSIFNAAGEVHGDLEEREVAGAPVAPVAEPPAAPAEAPKPDESIKMLIDNSNMQLAALLSAMQRQPPPTVEVTAGQEPVPWVVNVTKRNREGFISTFTLTPQRTK